VFGKLLTELLTDLEYQPLGPVATVAEATTLFRQEQPDLLLLDVNLPGEVSGIELARRLLDERPTPVVFLTSATDEDTFARAKAVGPAAYLTKPFDERALERALELALLNFAQRPEEADESMLTWSGELLMATCLFVKERGRLLKVRFEDILWIEADDRYSVLVTAARRYPLRMALRELATELPVNRFVQTHRSYLVNAEKIEALDPTDSLIIVGPRADELPLGRVYREPLLKRLHQVG
jgi:DNA-binding LytR/AlgR family response regulator